MRFFDELTQAEIGERIGTSQVHVGRLIAAAPAKLHRYSDEGPTSTGNEGPKDG